MIIPNLEEKVPAATTKASFNALEVQCPPTDNIDSAEIAFIGEAPTSIEVMEKEPFVGPAGSQFNRILNACGLPRYKLYITNCCKAQLPRNNTNTLWTEKGYRHPDWGKLQAALIEELSHFPGKIIIPLGVTAMRMLIDEPRFDKITRFRGSCYPTEAFPHLADKLPGKIICLTYHPASTLARNNPINFYVMINDIQKFLRLQDDPSLLEDKRIIHTQPSKTDVLDFYAEVLKQPETGFDIESTPEYITCFALTCSKYEGMSIPLMNNSGSYWPVEDEIEIWKGLAKILGASSVGKICQNGMFDIMFTLRSMGIISDNFLFDTMLAQHICWTDLPKGLDFLTSIYTYYPYHKDEGKQTHLKAIKDWPEYWIYNAKDAINLHEIKDNLEQELDKFKATDAMNYSMNLHKPLMEMEWNGILTDQAGIAKEKTKLNRKIRAMTHGLHKLAGRELNFNSPKQMKEYFYGHLKLPPYKSRSTGKPTCDAIAMSRIARKRKAGWVEAALIIKIRKLYKLVSTYFEINVDADHRLRCSHSISGTDTGRIATSKTFFGTGANLQNQPYPFKKYLIADEDCLLIEADLAKAEAHCVAFLSQDANMIEAFESGVDVHSFNASKIFSVPIEKIQAEKRVPNKLTMRDMGKKVVHASNYGMGPQTFSDNLAKEQIFMQARDCKILLNNYQKRFPGLKKWHKEINDQVYKTRCLFNMFNRPKRFLGMINAHLLRSAYAYIPQSTVAELLNRGMITMADDEFYMDHDIRFTTTVHDSVIFQVPKKELSNLNLILNHTKEHFSHTFYHKGRNFTIGLDAKIGPAWAGKTEEIATFNQESVDAALEKLRERKLL